MSEIINAQITNVSLGYEDHGILTFGLTLRFGACSVVYGGVALDAYDKQLKERVPSSQGLKLITEIMKTVGVDKWEDLNNKYIRIEDCGLGTIVDKIGNLMEDKWFSMKEFFDQ